MTEHCHQHCITGVKSETGGGLLASLLGISVHMWRSKAYISLPKKLKGKKAGTEAKRGQNLQTLGGGGRGTLTSL